MIIPNEIEAILERKPNLKALVQAFPMSFFGKFIKYDKQADIIKKWLHVRPKVCVISGWKRTAKTSIAAYLATCWLNKKLDKDWPGAKAMGIENTYEWNKKWQGERVGIIAGSSLDHIENVLLPMYQALIPPGSVKQWFSKTNKKIEIHGKSKFIIRTYEQDINEWKSGTSQMSHLDEEPFRDKFEETLERSKTVGGKIIITVALDDADLSWLPEACMNPMKYFGTDSFLHFKMGVEDVPNEIYPQIEKESTYRKYDDTPMRMAVRKGEWGYSSGRWWKNYDAKKHLVDPFPIPKHWLRWRACDAGFAAPTACAWCAMHPNGDIFIYREYYQKDRVIEERCKDIIELSGNLRQKEGDMWIEVQNNERYVMTLLDYHEFKRDQVSGDSTDTYYIQSGLIVCESTTLGQDARREAVNQWLNVDLKKNHFITHEPGAPSIYIFNTCTNLIYEASTKSVKKESSDRSSISERKIVNRGDHLLDCIEYLCVELKYWRDGHMNEKKKSRWDDPE